MIFTSYIKKSFSKLHCQKSFRLKQVFYKIVTPLTMTRLGRNTALSATLVLRERCFL